MFKHTVLNVVFNVARMSCNLELFHYVINDCGRMTCVVSELGERHKLYLWPVILNIGINSAVISSI